MPSPRSALLSLLVASSLAGPSLAQVPLGGIVTGNDIDRVQEIASAYGPVERRNDPDGTWIRGEIDGIVYSISFLNCNEAHADCTSVQFRAWWESEGRLSIEEMNQWNRDRRFSAAYLDEDMNATIEWDVNLAGGVTAVNFDDNLQWWSTVLRQFRERVADPQPEAAAPPVLTKRLPGPSASQRVR